MHFYGPLTQAQFVGDLLVKLARRQLQQDFALAATKRSYAIMGSLAPDIVGPRDIFGYLNLRAEIILKLAGCIEDRGYHHGISEWCAILFVVQDLDHHRLAPANAIAQHLRQPGLGPGTGQKPAIVPDNFRACVTGQRNERIIAFDDRIVRQPRIADDSCDGTARDHGGK